MMLLAVQIQTILYHLIAGWLYGFGFSLIQVLTQYRRRSFATAVVQIGYHLLFTLLLFGGLFQLNGGVTTVDLLLFFAAGVWLYYRFYRAVFFHAFTGLRLRLSRFFHKIAVAKSHILDIMIRNRIRRRKRRRRDGGKNRKKKKKKIAG